VFREKKAGHGEGYVEYEVSSWGGRCRLGRGDFREKKGKGFSSRGRGGYPRERSQNSKGTPRAFDDIWSILLI